MKWIFILLIHLPVLLCFAQSNTFPSSGNVGIGTTTPAQKLVVQAASGRYTAVGNIGQGIFKVNDNSALPQITLENTYAGANFGTQILFNLGYNGNVDVAGTSINAGSLIVAQESGWTSTVSNQDSYMAFKTSLDGSNTEKLRISSQGNVGIGTSSPTEKLSVNGNIIAKKVMVKQSGWSDYVFDEKYQLTPLSELAEFIRKNKRLPDMPSAQEVETNGISVGDNQALLLKKIEELTLYMINMERRQQKLENENGLLRSEIKMLKHKPEKK